MKRFSYHITALAAAILTAACSSFVEEQQEPAVVRASIGTETRTAIGPETENGHKVVWSEGDRIIISTGISSKQQATFKAADYGSPSASFIQEDASKTLDFTAGAIAGYPVENMYIGKPDENTELYFTIPTVQNYVKDSFDEGAMPMISDVVYEPVLNFHNAAGVLRLNLSTTESDVSISDIIITTSECISGECGYIPKSKKIFFDTSMYGSKQVALHCEEGVKISSDPTAFHIVAAHQTYSDMSIQVTTTDGRQQIFRMKSGKEITVKRSTVTTIPLTLDAIDETKDPRITIKIESVTFEDIKLKVEVKNVTSYYFGMQTKLSFLKDMESGLIAESVAYMTPYTSPMSYSGNITSFQPEMKDVLIEPGQSYIIWFIPYKQSGEYTSDDIIYVETMTKSFTSGGSVKVTYKDLEIDKTSISMTLSAPGAKYIYSTLLTDEELAAYETEEKVISMLLEPGGRSTVIDRSEDIFIRKFLRPGKRMTLFSLGIDKYGRYGPMLVETFETEPIPYNALKININKDLELANSTSTIKWSVSDGEAAGYRTFLQKTDSYRWINTFSQSVIQVQETMYLDPGLYYLGSTEETEIPITGLEEGEEYIFIVTAVDEESCISVADSWIFTYGQVNQDPD